MRKVIFLDRDGVINQMVMNDDHGLIDSPMRADQAMLLDGAAAAIRKLNEAAFDIIIVTNQPGAAKGKASFEQLSQVHDRILEKIRSQNGSILDSFICLHRKEDECNCRKPKTGLFESALAKYPDIDLKNSWMVGDGWTDIAAGQKMGLKTAFLSPKKCDICQVFTEKGVSAPDLWMESLLSFSKLV